ncbi:MAG: transglutaminase domain-containing protein, partial [Thermomicrobiales bacterium]
MAGRHEPQRETATTGSVRLTRRHLAGALVAGGALAAIGADLRKGMGRAASAQADIAATPPPVPVGTGYVSTAPTIAGKAAELGYDLDRIVAFVRTGVRYEPYAGALRGALGVLWSGAGNSVDQALLLAALLVESQIVCRVVTGELSAERQQALLTAAGGGAGVGMAGTPAATPSPPANLPTGTPPPGLGSLEPAYDRSRQLYRDAVDTIGAALAAAAIVLPVAMPPTLPDSEVYAHMWVEVADGPRWVRHDPTAGPDAGTAAVSATPLAGATPVAGDDPAAGLTHTVRVRIVAEELSAGTGVQRDVVTWEGTSIDLLATPVGVLIQTPGDLDGLGYTISEMFTGAASFVPVLAVGDDVQTAATPVVLGSSGSSSLAGALDAATPEGGGADGELVALWLAVDVQSPGRDPVSVQRTILDRIGVA